MSSHAKQQFLHSLPDESLYTLMHPDRVYTIHCPDDELDLMHGCAFGENGELLTHQIEKAGSQYQFTA